MSAGDVYLKAMMQLIARQTFSPERLLEIVAPTGSLQSVQIYNLCDGSRTQTEVATDSGTDRGNLSKQISRWIEEGVLVKVPENGSERPVHVYPIPGRLIPKKKGGKSNG